MSKKKNPDISVELEQFCNALATAYQDWGDTARDAELDWWHAFNDHTDVNVYVVEGRIKVIASFLDEDKEIGKAKEVVVVDRRLKVNKPQRVGAW